MLLFAFWITVLVSCLSVYRFADDPSPVYFYSDPKNCRQRLICTSLDAESFLQVFNAQPQTARLRILGRRSCTRSSRHLLLFQDPVLFDVALDLTPFLAGEGRLRSEGDAAVLEKHLTACNPLEVLILGKHVEWASWEDVATNIRQHLRTLGFLGEVEVRLEAREELLVYRNHPWQNFVRSRLTHCLVLLSLVGGFVWVPYLWIRMKTVRVESRFEINLDLERYWELLAAGLHASEGFQSQGLAR
mmetsp:Transcript_46875/g.108386  ORF Transcript_46875/g.108386 Transcript_46875/m.108386 type:complete len:245 (-) Transcript_46875:147-881(-)